MWYYIQSKQPVGPISQAFIAPLVANGTIARNTLVWCAGMTDWKEAHQTELAKIFLDIPPIVPFFVQQQPHSIPISNYTPESFRTLWLWTLWLTCLGLPLCLVIVGIPMVIAGVVTNLILIYRIWAIIQDGNARTTPGKAIGFCFIPIFNIYWFYVVIVGLAEDINRYCRERRISTVTVNEGLAVTSFVLACLALIPYVDFFTFIPQVIVSLILLNQATTASIGIIRHKASNGILCQL